MDPTPDYYSMVLGSMKSEREAKDIARWAAKEMAKRFDLAQRIHGVVAYPDKPLVDAILADDWPNVGRLSRGEEVRDNG